MAGNNNSSNWLNQFIASQQQKNAQQDQIANSQLASARSTLQLNTQPTVGGMNGSGMTVGDLLAMPTTNYNLPQEDVSGGPSILSRILEPFERGLSAVSGSVTDTIKEARGIDPTENPVQSAINSLKGNEHRDYIETAKALGFGDTASAILGTGANVFLDPANLALGPIGGLAVRGIKKGASVLRKGMTAEEAAKAAAEYKDLAAGARPDMTPPDENIPPSNPPGGAAPPVVPTPPPPAPVPPTPASAETVHGVVVSDPVPVPEPAPNIPASPVPVEVKAQAAAEANPAPAVPLGRQLAEPIQVNNSYVTGSPIVNDRAAQSLASSKLPVFSDNMDVQVAAEKLQSYIDQKATAYEVNKARKDLEETMAKAVPSDAAVLPPGNAPSPGFAPSPPPVPTEQELASAFAPEPTPAPTPEEPYNFESERERLKGVPSVKEAEKKLADAKGSSNFTDIQVKGLQRNLESKVQAASLRYPKEPEPVGTLADRMYKAGPNDALNLDSKIADVQSQLEAAQAHPSYAPHTEENPVMVTIETKKNGVVTKSEPVTLDDAREYMENQPMSVAKTKTIIPVDTARAGANANVNRLNHNLNVLKEQRAQIPDAAPVVPTMDTPEKQALANAMAAPEKPPRPDPFAGRESPFKEGDYVKVKIKVPDRKYKQTAQGKLYQDPKTGVITLNAGNQTIPIRLMPDGKMFGDVELVSYTPKGGSPVEVPGVTPKPAATRTPKAGTKTTKTAAEAIAEPAHPQLMPGDHVTIQRPVYGHKDQLHPQESGELFVDKNSGKLVFKTGAKDSRGRSVAVEVKQDAGGKMLGGQVLLNHVPAPKELTAELPPELPPEPPSAVNKILEEQPLAETPAKPEEVIPELKQAVEETLPKPPPEPLPESTPAPEEVRAAAGEIPDNPQEAIPHAQDAEKVIKNTKPVKPNDQGSFVDKLAATHLYNASRESASEMQRLGDAARNVQHDALVADREFHEAGGNYEVQASHTQRNPAIPETRTWDVGISDVMSLLGHKGIEDAVINPSTRLAGSQLLRMGAAALSAREAGLSTEEIANYVQRIGHSWGNTTNWVHKSYAGIRNAANVTKTISNTAWNIARNVERLYGRVGDNLFRARNAVAQAAGLTTNDVENQLANAITTEGGGTQASAVSALSNVGKLVSDSAGGNEKVINAAGPVIGEDVANVVSEGDIRSAKSIDERAKIRKDSTIPPKQQEQKVTAAASAQAVKDAADAKNNVQTVLNGGGGKPPEPPTPPGAPPPPPGGGGPPSIPPMDQKEVEANAAINEIASRKQRPIRTLLGTFGFNGHDIAQMALNGKSAAVTQSTEVKNLLGKIRKKYGDEVADSAFASLQSGDWPLEETRLAAARDMASVLEMAGADLSHMGGQAGDPLRGSAYGSQEYSLDDIRRAQEEAGLPKDFVNPPKSQWDALKAANPDKSERELISDAWRRVDAKNSLDFIGKFHAASQVLATRYAVGQHFFTEYASAVKHGDDWIRLADHLDVPGGSTYWQTIPKVDGKGNPIFYPKEAAVWVAHVEHATAAANGFTRSSGAIQKFIANHLDPLIATWKTSVTVAKPGYVIRNFNGDVMLNFLAGVNGIKAYKDAFQVARAGGLFKEKTIQAMQRNLMTPSDATAVGKWKGTVTLKGGKTQVLNDQAMYNLAKQNGVTLSYALSSDVIDARAGREGATAAQKIYDKVSANRVIQLSARVNEETSHIPRLAQFLHHMQDPAFTSKYRTLDEAARAATTNVRKYHPDVTSLSASGQNIMRKVMPFYSWARLVTPMILETALTRPNAITGLPKIYYGINKAQGGNPPNFFEGIDKTRLVPDYVRNMLGYVGGNATFDLGSPVESLEQTFPGRNTQDLMRGGVYNMLNPLIKAPIDLGTGIDQSTGKGIPAKQEYIDQMVPFFGDISQVSGISPTGSLGRIVTGQGVIDPQRAVQSGEKNYFWNQGLLNFLSGLHYANFNRASYTNVAQKQYKAGTL